MHYFSYKATAAETRSLLEILQKEGQYVSAPCGGKGTCGKCVVRFVKNPTMPSAEDEKRFSIEQQEQGYRLACQSYPKEPFLLELQEEEEQIEVETRGFGEFLREKEENPEQKQEGMAKDDRRKQIKDTEAELYGDGKVKRKPDGYGIAVDIGSTTLAAVLVELSSGKRCQTAASVNHQRIYGADVLSRIQASNQGKKWEMQRCIRQDLKKLLSDLTEREGIEAGQVTEIVVAGNTTMCHLLRGFSCETLGTAPFQPVDITRMEGTAEMLLGLRGWSARTVILPGISAFIGADITAGMAVVKLDQKDASSLFLDIGTNGEMALGNRDRIYATATSAGPAFEGGNISCGMAGIPGAISHVKILSDQTAQIEVIGGGKAAGICGTGIIDLVAELSEHGLIDAHGTFTDAYFEKGYPVAEGICFTQKDVRELQMAKAAIRAGIEMLLRKAGLAPEQISTCYLAGGFGTQIEVEQAVRIGLIPDGLKEKTVAAGNTVLEGTVQYLLGKISEKDWEHIVQITGEMNLAMEPEFEELYVKYMDF